VRAGFHGCTVCEKWRITIYGPLRYTKARWLLRWQRTEHQASVMAAPDPEKEEPSLRLPLGDDGGPPCSCPSLAA
jgi:hypothetical protein